MMERDLTPQPGDVWERDGHTVAVAIVGHRVRVTDGHVVDGWDIDDWQVWARGARLIKRSGKKDEGSDE